MNSLPPPIDTGIEHSVIGAILLDAEKVLPQIKRFQVVPEWFFTPESRIVFESVRTLGQKNCPVDAMTVSHFLKNEGRLDSFADGFLEMCMDKCPTVTHVNSYLEQLRDLYMKRERILPALYKAMANVDSNASSMDIISDLRSEMDKMGEADPLAVSQDAIKDRVREQRKQALEHGFTGIPSRWPALQEFLGGYRPSKMCLFGARPSVGKTTIALNEARFQVAANVDPVPTGFISLETDCTEIYEQLAAEHLSTTKITDASGATRVVPFDLHKYYTGGITNPATLKHFDDIMEWYFRRPFYPTDATMNIDQICWTIQMQVEKYGMRMCFVDYIQIIKDNDVMRGMRDARSKFGYASNRLFETFRQTKVAGVVLAQLNRDAEIPQNVSGPDRWKYTPQLRHLKETGKLEEDAYQAVLFSPDPTVEHPEKELNVDILANVAKNKRGPRGRVFLNHRKQDQAVNSTTRTPEF